MLTATVLVVCALALVSVATPTDKPYYALEQAEQHFEQFMRTHGKKYADEQEKQRRFEIFKESLNQVNELNAREELAVFDIQPYSDLSEEEIMSQYTSYKLQAMPIAPKCKQVPGEEFLNEDIHAPDRYDWRIRYAVSRVKDQRKCSSSWAFATTGILEGQYAKKFKNMVEFSEQQLIDCDKSNHGCFGGEMSQASIYLTKHGAIAEADYTYTAEDTGKCQYDAAQVYINVTSCSNFTTTDEEQLKTTLFKTGPVGVVVDAKDLLLYKQGILKQCSYHKGNHHILLVGYGIDNDVPFWTFKNSWSQKYGEEGFVRVQRGINACGLMNGEKISMQL